jgi:hypothetical protein
MISRAIFTAETQSSQSLDYFLFKTVYSALGEKSEVLFTTGKPSSQGLLQGYAPFA